MSDESRQPGEHRQPASQPMNAATAAWYRQRTRGQLQPGRADNGTWYLYLNTRPSGRLP